MLLERSHVLVHMPAQVFGLTGSFAKAERLLLNANCGVEIPQLRVRGRKRIEVARIAIPSDATPESSMSKGQLSISVTRI